MSSTISARSNTAIIEQKYEEWKKNPDSLTEDWKYFFEGFELGSSLINKESNTDESNDLDKYDLSFRSKIVSMLRQYRYLGHSEAWLDPLKEGYPEKEIFSLKKLGFEKQDLEKEVSSKFFEDGKSMKLCDMIDQLEKIYCDKIGFEFVHIQDEQIRHWLRHKIENRIKVAEEPEEKNKLAFKWLAEAELFEKFLHKKYVGQKRFSLEGGDALMIALNGLTHILPEYGIKEITMGMAHRGRLNVLANLLKKPLKVILYEFSENYVPNLVAGDGDVKYHLGYKSKVKVGNDDINIHLTANPSHLEAVNSVVEGIARAKQCYNDPDFRDSFVDRSSILPVLIHGDAAFAGQGSVSETLNLSQLLGYATGGTVHFIINNQIGFTTTPEDARSSMYCSDVAKIIEAPVFHVNGDSPMDVLFVTELALEFRQKFQRDVVVDVVCYRRHGHNEGDEPNFTLPKTYKDIRSHDTPLKIYKEYLLNNTSISKDDLDSIISEYQNKLESQNLELMKSMEKQEGHPMSDALVEVQPEYSHDPVDTGVSIDEIRDIGIKISTPPNKININEKLEQRFLTPRNKAIQEGKGINWAFAESLAFGSLLKEDKSVRLSGQDSRRGTFSQRHVVLYDPETRKRYTPLNHVKENQKRKLWVYNSNLSEFAVLGFEYGYSLVADQTLVLWEAQFGDFCNGAQVIIDQFITSSESKWQQSNNLVLLLPHGYEGQGPEHSSARLERFLQMCSEQNIQVCNLTTPAQYFHLLRRQMYRKFRKPLVIMTPKSLLTHSECVSNIEDFASGTCFKEIFDDNDEFRGRVDKISRIIFCTGKVYYDLIKYRKDNEINNAAIIRIEQIYPFHREAIEKIVSNYPNASKWVWCQEEPLNMGAWTFIGPRLQKMTNHKVRYAGRDSATSPSSGAKAIHVLEQKKLVEKAFSK